MDDESFYIRATYVRNIRDSKRERQKLRKEQPGTALISDTPVCQICPSPPVDLCLDSVIIAECPEAMVQA